MVLVGLVLWGTAPAGAHQQVQTPGSRALRTVEPAAPFEGPVPEATCGAGASKETGLQGQVPRADRDSGRSAQGYRCNLERIGQFQGEGASWVNQSYGDCAYLSTHAPSLASSPGVQVIDVRDPTAPKRAGALTSPAMTGTWETLKVHAGRGLLAAVFAPSPAGNGGAFFDVYDIATDCTRPRLISSTVLPVSGHEGDFAPDGMTYWAAGAYTSVLSAIDVRDPASPRVLYTGRTGNGNHGFGFSPDGRRLYLAEAGRLGSGALLTSTPDDLLSPNGLQIFDVSAVQDRRPSPQITQLGRLLWTDGAAGQHTIHVTYAGRPYLVYVDELLSGAARIIDIADETAPRIVSKLKLEIQMPEREAVRRADTTNPVLFGYDAHYCTVDRQTDPTTLACGYFASGVRVFDIRDPARPVELAYYNPPAPVGKTVLDLPSSEHAATAGDMTTDWCSSPPRFVGATLWVTCQDSGFQVLRFTNGVYPQPSGAPADLGLPRACVSRRRFTIRLPRGLRSATVTLDGRRVQTLRGKRLRSVIDLRGLPRGTFRVRVTARTMRGRRVVQERTYRTCRAR